MHLKRTAYQDLLAWKKEPTAKPLLLLGARQVGKTHLIQTFSKKEFGVAHYFNFELTRTLKEVFEQSLEPVHLLRELSIRAGSDIDSKNDLIIFDEIQASPRTLTSLKYFAELLPEQKIIAAGSLLGVALREQNEEFSFPVGKVKSLFLYPLTFFEFLEALGETHLLKYIMEVQLNSEISQDVHLKLWNIWKEYLVVGGLPEVVSSYVIHRQQPNFAFQTVRENQNELIDNYMADIAKHAGKENILIISRIFKSLAAQLGKDLRGKASKFRFKDVEKRATFKKLSGPIDWLVASDLIIQNFLIENIANPLDQFTIDNRFKLFSFDVGILNALARISSSSILEFTMGSFKGFIAENFVAQELKSQGEHSLFSWVSGREAEVEFLINYHEHIIPVEVKSGNVLRMKSLQQYEEKYRPKASVVLSGLSRVSQGENRRIYLPLYLSGRVFELVGQGG